MKKNDFTETKASRISPIVDFIYGQTRKIRTVLKMLYNVLSVIATLTIFSGLIIYLYGHFVKNNQSDNDLIMSQIIEEANGDEIMAINVVDIHGFGNNSIIASTSNINLVSYDEEYSNNLMVLDIAENEILHNMEDFLSVKSSYKTTFLYTLLSDEIRFIPKTEYVLDIIGDSTKEIIVKYYVFGSDNGENGTAIFGYSYSDTEYKLIGTYPESKKVNLHVYNDEGSDVGRFTLRIKTNFNGDSINRNNMFKCYDKEKSFYLNHGKRNGREYWIDTSAYGYVLATVNMDYLPNNPTYINVYGPIYDSQDRELEWCLLYSEGVEEFPFYYMEDDLLGALTDIIGGQVTLVEACNDWGY